MDNETEQALWQALRGVVEPDLGENIVDLGLVQAVRAGRQGDAQIDITMTTRHSQHAEAVVDAVRRAAQGAGAPGAVVRLVYEPPWTPYQMAAPLRALLGLPDLEPDPPAQPVQRVGWRERLRSRLTG